MDLSAKIDSSIAPENSLNTSCPGKIAESLGGVGRNVAEACFRTGGNPKFISVVGDDISGNAIINHLSKIKMDVQAIKQIKHTTAKYNAMLDAKGNLITAVADMRIHDEIKSQDVAEYIQSEKPSVVAVDGNVSVECLDELTTLCFKHKIPLVFEPTSISKGQKAFYTTIPHLISCITPDRHEGLALAQWIDTEFSHLAKRTCDPFLSIKG